jgi:hypothetical protein
MFRTAAIQSACSVARTAALLRATEISHFRASYAPTERLESQKPWSYSQKMLILE